MRLGSLFSVSAGLTRGWGGVSWRRPTKKETRFDEAVCL
jgi:hypothetical protein